MKKFAVFSGFLGSGKTTTMMALTRYDTARHGKAAMISNDLGEGVTLADDRLARLSGVNASQITDECICFCRDVLASRSSASVTPSPRSLEIMAALPWCAVSYRVSAIMVVVFPEPRKPLNTANFFMPVSLSQLLQPSSCFPSVCFFSEVRGRVSHGES